MVPLYFTLGMVIFLVIFSVCFIFLLFPFVRIVAQNFKVCLFKSQYIITKGLWRLQDIVMDSFIWNKMLSCNGLSTNKKFMHIFKFYRQILRVPINSFNLLFYCNQDKMLNLVTHFISTSTIWKCFGS